MLESSSSIQIHTSPWGKGERGGGEGRMGGGEGQEEGRREKGRGGREKERMDEGGEEER